jgi:hypothetical protein
MFDQNTGQAYFHPRVGRPPKTHLRPGDPISLSEQLYKQARISRERIQKQSYGVLIANWGRTLNQIKRGEISEQVC